ncbi:DUF424 family protein [Natronomonas pharaonis DSM 2160]|uniref:DUF424 family protein n=1 Tax=Natronomonas pharaonis (strain ATCC 35678 / DSM 2160 / CIP 103997 / JCM 8858 / NBRC 14720 / NCIMB 2260 / Gabara) TaxID=348780 RepID=A0A1U7EUF1_NATPD|nr:DUF424 family protein [Natronomonas pharaonis DSM 2160]
MTLLLCERSTPEGLLVSVCDADVLGETFDNGDVSLTVEPEFYDGETASHEEVTASLADAAVANLVGHEAVGLAVEHGFVAEANVLEFEETVHAQYLRL